MHESPETNRLAVALAELGRALERLSEALSVGADNPLMIDGTTQRFEFSFELLWKALKVALYDTQGFDAVSPKQTLQKAYAVGWLNDEKLWIDMLKDRNLTSHTYKEDLAQEIYAHIHGYYPEMRRVHHLLASRYGKPSKTPEEFGRVPADASTDDGNPPLG
jgi:nucleotidyltransferase substrate binding protein (TIGR01987 family)